MKHLAFSLKEAININSMVNCNSVGMTGRPGVLRFMGSQRVVHDGENELN